MIHLTIGNTGHFLVILSFILSLASGLSYLRSALASNEISRKAFAMDGKWLFMAHCLAIGGVILTLFLIIYNNYFEYHYAYTHASKFLPAHFMISCFWEGQEGSFLLWIFWNCLLGILIIMADKKWQSPVMTIFALAQALLTSMILGVVILNIKIGSSPFLLLRDVIQDPIFEINPEFVPRDGTGLNPLLQNYWMVIHPPVLFLGYATTLVPFAYLIAGLWKRQYREWVRPALPWAIFSTATMALGQLMGAYWAYETLSFGGYWSWDPVENAVYIPWIVQVASIHTLLIYKKNNAALKTSMVLVASTFLLILYATFLTRSGILGNASVHSFTDLGLSGQLLIYMLVFLVLTIILMAVRWKEIPTSDKELSVYNKDFWIFIGATVLSLMAFQVLVPTSFPVFNKIAELFGAEINLAPPAEQAIFYSKFQIWGGILIAIISGTAQYFWWKSISRPNLWYHFALPIILSMAISIVVFKLAKISNLSYILLLTAVFYSFLTNGNIVFNLFRKKQIMRSGGAVSHIGIALMLLGILFSAGYSRIISLNKSGMVYSKEMSDELNMENVLLFLNEPRQMNDYQLIYKGRRIDVIDVPGFVNKNFLFPTADPHMMIAREDYSHKGKLYFSAGDTVEIQPENTYYEVEYQKSGSKAFTLYPRAQVNPNMGLIVSPDIQRKIDRDLYTHISSIPNPESPMEWVDTVDLQVQMNQQFFVNDYVAELKNIKRLDHIAEIPLGPSDVAVEAEIEILGKSKNYVAHPIFIIQDKRVGNIPDVIEDLAVKFSFTNILPQENRFEFTVQTAQKDYIIMKAIEMPLINVLWIGTLVLMIGMGIAFSKRYSEFRKKQDFSL